MNLFKLIFNIGDEVKVINPKSMCIPYDHDFIGVLEENSSLRDNEYYVRDKNNMGWYVYQHNIRQIK